MQSKTTPPCQKPTYKIIMCLIWHETPTFATMLIVAKLPLMLYKKPLRLCTISIQILVIIYKNTAFPYLLYLNLIVFLAFAFIFLTKKVFNDIESFPVSSTHSLMHANHVFVICCKKLGYRACQAYHLVHMHNYHIMCYDNYSVEHKHV